MPSTSKPPRLSLLHSVVCVARRQSRGGPGGRLQEPARLAVLRAGFGGFRLPRGGRHGPYGGLRPSGPQLLGDIGHRAQHDAARHSQSTCERPAACRTEGLRHIRQCACTARPPPLLSVAQLSHKAAGRCSVNVDQSPASLVRLEERDSGWAACSAASIAHRSLTLLQLHAAAMHGSLGRA